jgi:hypothetical protein
VLSFLRIRWLLPLMAVGILSMLRQVMLAVNDGRGRRR